MSNKRTGELLETYDEIIEDFDKRCGLYEDTKEQVAEIRNLIEHGPEVSREFVGRWAMLFRQDEISVNKTGHHLDWEKYIEHLLCEAGVTVKRG